MGYVSPHFCSYNNYGNVINWEQNEFSEVINGEGLVADTLTESNKVKSD